MRYELYIKTDKWYELNFGRDVPAMNYQAGNIAELKDRQVDYSQSLKLPKTANNARVFGYINSHDSTADVPYKLLPCRLYADGHSLAGDSAVLKVIRVSDFFEVQILGGSAGFFESLKKTNFDDLDFGRFKRGSFKPSTGGNNKPMAIDACMGFSYTSPKAEEDNSKYGLPLVSVWEGLKKVCAHKGYSLQSNVESKLKDVHTSLCGAMPDEATAKGISGFAGEIDNQFTVKPMNVWNFSTPFPIISGSEWLTKVPYSEELTVFRWSAPENTILDMTVSLHGILKKESQRGEMPIGESLVRVNIEKNGNAFFDEPIYGESSNEDRIVTYNNVKKTKNIELKKGETIDIRIYANRNTGESVFLYELKPKTGYRMSLSIDVVSVTETPINTSLPLSINLGFPTPFDYLKAIAQAIGGVVTVNERDKTVGLYTFDLLLNRKAQAPDWTNKIIGKPNSVAFAVENYNKKNKIAYKAWEYLSDALTLETNATVAEEEKKLFDLAFEAGADFRAEGWDSRLAWIPLYDEKWNLNRNPKPHLLTVRKHQLASVGMTANALLGAELKSRFFNGLSEILKDPQVVDIKLMLTAQDVEFFRLSGENALTPIYLGGEFGSYFFVNKIKNFVAGKPTAVELIKI